MSVIPAGRLSRSDLCLLGNNLVPSTRERDESANLIIASNRELAAVNRSLSALGERLSELHPSPTAPRS